MTSYAAAGQLQQRPAPREGGLFKPEWFAIVDAVPAGAVAVRAWDLAATLHKGAGDPDFTAGVLMSRDRQGFFYVENVVRLRDTADGVERAIRSTASQDGVRVEIVIPRDPGQAGKGQASYLARTLAGYRVHVARPTGDKAARAAPWPRRQRPAMSGSCVVLGTRPSSRSFRAFRWAAMTTRWTRRLTPSCACC